MLAQGSAGTAEPQHPEQRPRAERPLLRFGVARSVQALGWGISAFSHSVLYFLIFDFYGFSFTSLIRERQQDGIVQSFNID